MNDVIIEETFENNLINECKKCEYNVFSLMPPITSCFLTDINYDVCIKYLENKSINYNINNTWHPTTNHCIKREILIDFVDWYFPSYLQIKDLDYNKLSWYHERFFAVYLNNAQSSIKYLPGLHHTQSNSHSTFNS